MFNSRPGVDLGTDLESYGSGDDRQSRSSIAIGEMGRRRGMDSSAIARAGRSVERRKAVVYQAPDMHYLK